MTDQPKLLIFASGSADGGGSGFANLVWASRHGILDADIIGVVSNHAHGGVSELAHHLGIPFHFLEPPFSAENYRLVAERTGAQWFALSGWLKLVLGLDPRRTFNIHPGPLPRYGGLYGHRVHDAVLRDFLDGVIDASAVSMHFIIESASMEDRNDYDKGPVFFRMPVVIKRVDTPQTLQLRVNSFEHAWQPFVTNLVIHERVAWDGKDPGSLEAPLWLPH